MGKIILDRTMREKLRDLKECLELCDESGRVLGYVTPAAIYENLSSPHSEGELDRREAETETFSTAEVLSHLERL